MPSVAAALRVSWCEAVGSHSLFLGRWVSVKFTVEQLMDLRIGGCARPAGM